MGERLKLADDNVLAFATIIDFPMFDRDPRTGRLLAMHHPFTEIKENNLPRLEKEPEQVISKSYDFVCNGHEVSSGSIRIHSSDMQRRVLNMLGYSDEDIDARFGHLLEAFDYGAPPHGGAAPGIDRTVMLLTGEENIREVIAFPKNQSAADLTFEAPSAVTEEQLDELHICLKEEPL
jgi:aspartyl-tRNA synthetase